MKENWLWKMVLFFRVNLLKEILMVMVWWIMPMVISMMENGKKIKNMEKQFILLEMEMFLKEVLEMVYNMEKVLWEKKMGLFILGNM